MKKEDILLEAIQVFWTFHRTKNQLTIEAIRNLLKNRTDRGAANWAFILASLFAIVFMVIATMNGILFLLCLAFIFIGVGSLAFLTISKAFRAKKKTKKERGVVVIKSKSSHPTNKEVVYLTEM